MGFETLRFGRLLSAPAHQLYASTHVVIGGTRAVGGTGFSCSRGLEAVMCRLRALCRPLSEAMLEPGTLQDLRGRTPAT